MPDLAKQVALVVLLGKALDFTIKWTGAPSFDPGVAVIAIDPDPELTARARREKAENLIHAFVAAPDLAAEKLAASGSGAASRGKAWLSAARRALDARPASWRDLVSKTPGRLHPAEVFRALRPFVERDPDTILICDGGEYAQ